MDYWLKLDVFDISSFPLLLAVSTTVTSRRATVINQKPVHYFNSVTWIHCTGRNQTSHCTLIGTAPTSLILFQRFFPFWLKFIDVLLLNETEPANLDENQREMSRTCPRILTIAANSERVVTTLPSPSKNDMKRKKRRWNITAARKKPIQLNVLTQRQWNHN